MRWVTWLRLLGFALFFFAIWQRKGNVALARFTLIAGFLVMALALIIYFVQRLRGAEPR